MTKRPIEQTGLIPRSILRTFERFRKQILPGAEMLVIQEFRISRYQVIVSARCLITLISVPLLVNGLSKSFFIKPGVEYFWNQSHNEIFLNSYQENRALADLHKFEEKLYFESFANPTGIPILKDVNDSNLKVADPTLGTHFFNFGTFPSFAATSPPQMNFLGEGGEEDQPFQFSKQLQKETLEIARTYNLESIEAISNLFADFLSFLSFSVVFVLLKPQIVILKAFLSQSLYSLSDTTKSFLLILGTDLLVGFHSPRGWEVFLEWLLRHFGLPESTEFMSLFVATFPVFLDTVFKYWIFRTLNKISPSTVATYHNMIE